MIFDLDYIRKDDYKMSFALTDCSKISSAQYELYITLQVTLTFRKLCMLNILYQKLFEHT